MELLQINDLEFYYHEDEKIITEFNMSLNNNELVAIMGNSGCGKSTLLSLIAGYIKPKSGYIKCFSKHRPSFVFQSPFLLDEFTLLENVILPLILKGEKVKSAKQKAKDVLKTVGIDEEMFNKKPAQLSGGERARTNIARALIQESSIVLLDEPTGSLDSHNAKQIMELLLDLKKDRLIIIVTHDKSLALNYADKVYHYENQTIKKIIDKTSSDKNNTASKDKYKRIKNISLYNALKITFKWFKFKPCRNIISIFFMSLVLSFLMLASFIILKSSEAFIYAGKSIYNYNFCRIAKIEKTISDNELSFEKLEFPKFDEINRVSGEYILEEFLPLENVLNATIKIFSQDKKEYSNVRFEPDIGKNNNISYGKESFNFDEVVVNQEFIKKYNINEDNYHNFTFEIPFNKSIATNINDKKILDKVNFKIEFKIVGISNETSLFSSPCVYYSYAELYSYLNKIYLNNLSIEMNKPISVIERLENYSLLNDASLGYYGYYYCNKPYELMEELQDNYKITSIALENITNSQKIISSIATIFIVFFFLILISSFSLITITIKTLYEEQRKKLALFKSFNVNKNSYKRVYYSLSHIFSITVFILSIIFQRLIIHICSFQFNKLNYPNFLNISLYSPLNILLILICFFICRFSAWISYKNIDRLGIINTLGEEK